jgi:hypothetical protein
MKEEFEGKKCEKRQKSIKRMDKEKEKMYAPLASSNGNGDSTMVTSGDIGCCFLQEQPLQAIPTFFIMNFGYPPPHM